VGNGSFRVDQLATFTGFERIALDNETSQFATVTLGSQPIEVDAIGNTEVLANSPASWNGSNIIKGDSAHATYVFLDNSSTGPVTYDLTSNSFSSVYAVDSDSSNVTLLINSSDTAGIGSFTAFGTNDRLVTAASTLDLSHTAVTGFTVV